MMDKSMREERQIVTGAGFASDRDMSQVRVLVVEDNQDIAANICDYLEAQGAVTDYAADGLVGLHLAATGDFDVIILDVMLPGIDGVELCRRLRDSSALQPPVLMLTALDALDDKLAGFEAGADDYLVKPFAFEELHVRLRALVARSRGGHNPVLKVGPLVMDVGAMRVAREGVPLNLNRATFSVLRILMEAYPNVVSRQEMEYALWGDTPPRSDALRSHIYALRSKLDKGFDHTMVQTVHGVGFKLVASDE